MIVCDWEKYLELLNCKGYKDLCDFTVVEPRHGMYLNSLRFAASLITVKVEPKHRMYLNSTLNSILASAICVEPKHNM